MFLCRKVRSLPVSQGIRSPLLFGPELGNSVPPPPPPPPPPDRNPWMHKTNYPGPSSLGNWVPPGPKSLDVVIYTFVLVHKTALLEDIDTDAGDRLVYPPVVWTVSDQVCTTYIDTRVKLCMGMQFYSYCRCQ